MNGQCAKASGKGKRRGGGGLVAQCDAVGADVGVSKRLTLAFDFLGTYVMKSPRLVREVFTAADGEPFSQIGFVKESYNMASGAAGLKFNPAGRLLVDFNVLFKLDNAGLRDKVTPLFGIEYAF